MAGASMNDIKGRIKSVSGTMQITKAMELVATSKLRRAREKIESSRPFHKIIREAIDGIEAAGEVVESVSMMVRFRKPHHGCLMCWTRIESKRPFSWWEIMLENILTYMKR